ncbi:hypothetical protein RRG08_043319 [Elysia crispata]|uniref:Uncharacterized protein n=1 Tax=Elysia crispata TaxID=231223 RepID=A0AAE1BAG3_9GAST|nr:hypothetical protein RRG08_043319 [Elysia crispata]
MFIRQGGKSAQQQHKIALPASPKKNASVATILAPSNAILSSGSLSSNKITCLSSPKLQDTKSNVLSQGVKRQHNGQLVVAFESSSLESPTLPAPLQSVTTQPEATEATDPDNLFSGAAGNFAGSLTDADMDTSLNFLNDFGMDFLVSNEPQLKFDLAADSDNSGDSSVPNPSFLKVEDIGCASPPASELNPIKLFDEIYEHYLNIKDPSKTDSPNPSVHSDSGVGSDVEPLSPLSNGESLNDDYLWQDLFPDLQ